MNCGRRRGLRVGVGRELCVDAVVAVVLATIDAVVVVEAAGGGWLEFGLGSLPSTSLPGPAGLVMPPWALMMEPTIWSGQLRAPVISVSVTLHEI